MSIIIFHLFTSLHSNSYGHVKPQRFPILFPTLQLNIYVTTYPNKMDLPKSALRLMFSLARMTSMDDAILSPRYPRICCGELTNKYPQLLIFTWVLSLFQMFSHALRTVLPPSQLPRFYPYSTMASNITLYTWPTPNGIKASITLEELGLPYKTEGIDISSSSNPQKQEYNSLHYAARCLTIY